MRKQLGQEKQEAREAAVTILASLRGKNIKSLNNNEVKDLVAALLQLLGLADQDGNLK